MLIRIVQNRNIKVLVSPEFRSPLITFYSLFMSIEINIGLRNSVASYLLNLYFIAHIFNNNNSRNMTWVKRYAT